MNTGLLKQLKGFSRYLANPDTGEMFYLRKKEWVPMKKWHIGRRFYYSVRDDENRKTVWLEISNIIFALRHDIDPRRIPKDFILYAKNGKIDVIERSKFLSEIGKKRWATRIEPEPVAEIDRQITFLLKLKAAHQDNNFMQIVPEIYKHERYVRSIILRHLYKREAYLLDELWEQTLDETLHQLSVRKYVVSNLPKYMAKIAGIKTKEYRRQLKQQADSFDNILKLKHYAEN